MPPPHTTYSRTYCTAEVVLSENEIEANGAAGVRLSEGADPLLERNTVRGSGPSPNPNPTLTLTLTLTRARARTLLLYP